jgi:hypothetical protein
MCSPITAAGWREYARESPRGGGRGERGSSSGRALRRGDPHGPARGARPRGEGRHGCGQWDGARSRASTCTCCASVPCPVWMLMEAGHDRSFSASSPPSIPTHPARTRLGPASTASCSTSPPASPRATRAEVHVAHAWRLQGGAGAAPCARFTSARPEGVERHAGTAGKPARRRACEELLALYPQVPPANRHLLKGEPGRRRRAVRANRDEDGPDRDGHGRAQRAFGFRDGQYRRDDAEGRPRLGARGQAGGVRHAR